MHEHESDCAREFVKGRLSLRRFLISLWGLTRSHNPLLQSSAFGSDKALTPADLTAPARLPDVGVLARSFAKGDTSIAIQLAPNSVSNLDDEIQVISPFG